MKTLFLKLTEFSTTVLINVQPTKRFMQIALVTISNKSHFIHTNALLSKFEQMNKFCRTNNSVRRKK